jgi:hypothetical protein
VRFQNHPLKPVSFANNEDLTCQKLLSIFFSKLGPSGKILSGHN